MDTLKLDPERAVKLFGWHAVHGPTEAVLRLPAGSENYVRMSLDTTGRTPTARYTEPGERGGCYALARRIRTRNGAACRLELPNTNPQQCYLLTKRGDIVVKREDLEGLTVGFTWALLPRLRTGYLVEFTDDGMVISCSPPESASDTELFELLWEHTNTANGELLEYRASLRAMRGPKEAVDPRRVIRPTHVPPPVLQYLAQIGVDGERRMVWTQNPNQVSRYNEVAGRLRRAMENAPPPDDFDSSIARLDQVAREIEAHPSYRLARLVNAATRAVTGRKR